MNYGLTFNEKHSYKDFNIIMRSVDRSLLPDVRRQTSTVYPIDGNFDLQKEPIYENRIISIDFSFIFKGLEQLREKQRTIATWLCGRSRLIFDDEPDKYYDAKVYSAISITNEGSFATFSVAFECSPFAYDINFTQQTKVYKENSQSMMVNVKGRDSPCIIYLKNLGDTDIKDLKITRQIKI